jgi:hypothetical protein
MERAVLMATTSTLAALGGVKLASSSLAGKAAMAAVMVAVVGTTAAVTVAVLPAGFGREPRRPLPARAVAPQVVKPPPPPAAPPEVVKPEPQSVVQEPDALAAPRAVERVRASPVVKAPPPPLAAPSSPPPAPPTASSLAAELELLRAAKVELDAGRWESALQAITRHDTEFPEGALGLEADVIRVLAWCGQGRTGEALERAHQLRTRAPNSPAISRLAGSCVEL